jgi:sugar-phosphatase
MSEGKPSPEPYNLALGRLGLSASGSVVIEDSKSGIASALAADCDVVAVTTSHPAVELWEASPTYVADSFLDARRQIEGV